MASLAPETVAAAFVGALESAGGTVVEAVSHNFPGAGLTCVLILAESHAVLHTWPETGTVNIDIFSCSTRLRSLAAIDEIGQTFGAARVYRAGDSPCRRTFPLARRTRVSSCCTAVAVSLGLFGLLRLAWIEAHVVLPLTQLQARLRSGCSARRRCRSKSTLACSGADALALCLGAVLAYPARWRTRLAGAAARRRR